MEALTRGSRRRTKIVATLGPATDDPDVVEALICAGADVLRFNFSYGAAEEQGGRVAQVRSIASKLGRYVGIMGDLQGPKIRIESFRRGSVVLERGQVFELD
ncbi:MAG: pyruvate kinase, partial [Rhodospirillaceae bacterium]|nr:pyruvate kinase [Rhodospirillaceae bacterium]